MLSLAELNPYSQRFAERLFARHPDWGAFAHPDPAGFPSPGSLLVEVPSPVAARALMIRTYGDQVTVDFGPHAWHDHFGSWSAPTESAVFDLALSFIDDLLQEHVVVVTRFFFGRQAWSRVVPVARLKRPRFGRVEIYSWTGSRDSPLVPA